MGEFDSGSVKEKTVVENLQAVLCKGGGRDPEWMALGLADYLSELLKYEHRTRA